MTAKRRPPRSLPTPPRTSRNGRSARAAGLSRRPGTCSRIGKRAPSRSRHIGPDTAASRSVLGNRGQGRHLARSASAKGYPPVRRSPRPPGRGFAVRRPARRTCPSALAPSRSDRSDQIDAQSVKRTGGRGRWSVGACCGAGELGTGLVMEITLALKNLNGSPTHRRTESFLWPIRDLYGPARGGGRAEPRFSAFGPGGGGPTRLDDP